MYAYRYVSMKLVCITPENKDMELIIYLNKVSNNVYLF